MFFVLSLPCSPYSTDEFELVEYLYKKKVFSSKNQMILWMRCFEGEQILCSTA